MNGRLAYVVSRFPKLSETFILREILALRERGWPISLYSIQHERTAVRHPEVVELEAHARYLQPLSADTLRANARLASRSPDLYRRLLADVVLGNRGSVDYLAKGLAILPGAVALAEQMRCEGVQHIHAHFGTHPALLALLAARILGIGFSFTVHAHDVFVDSTMLGEKIRRARFVVTISEFNRQLLVRLGGAGTTDTIHVVRCGVDVTSYRFRERAQRADPLHLIAVGSLQEYKGHDRLIRACALLRSAQPDRPFICSIVGDGILRPALEQLIADLGLRDQVRLLGALDQHAVKRAIGDADLLVLPSVVARNGQMEGIPVVLMEAMALGTPVVATRISGIPELVRHGDTGLLVPPDDPSALRDAILACRTAPEAAAARAKRGRALVEQEYDLRANVGRLANLFGQIVPLRGRHGLVSGDRHEPVREVGRTW